MYKKQVEDACQTGVYKRLQPQADDVRLKFARDAIHLVLRDLTMERARSNTLSETALQMRKRKGGGWGGRKDMDEVCEGGKRGRYWCRMGRELMQV